MKKIIYDKTTGDILIKTEVYQFIDNLFVNENQEFKDNLGSIDVENPPGSIRMYKIVNGKLVERGEVDGL